MSSSTTVPRYSREYVDLVTPEVINLVTPSTGTCTIGTSNTWSTLGTSESLESWEYFDPTENGFFVHRHVRSIDNMRHRMRVRRNALNEGFGYF